MATGINQYHSDDLKKLVSTLTYREFIVTCIEVRSQNGRRFGYSDIARKASFKSRSFPRDVTLGSKKLTPASLEKFILGLGLKGTLAEYFKTLVEIEIPECRNYKFQFEKAENKLRNLRSRLLKKSHSVSNSTTEKQNPDAPFELSAIPKVYAALGVPDIGATVHELRQRTELPSIQIHPILQKLLAAGLIRKNKDRFIAQENHLNLPDLKQSAIFKQFFLNSLVEASQKARTHFNSDENLFFSSSFSIKKSDLPSLKNDLRETLLRYVDDSEKPQGDKVVSLACAMFTP